MTPADIENRRTLQKLSSQAGASSLRALSQCDEASSGQPRSGRIMLVVAPLLLMGTAWMMYSHWPQRPDGEQTPAAAASIADKPHSTEGGSLGTSSWASASRDSANAQPEKPSPAMPAAAAVARSPAATPSRDATLEDRVRPVEDLVRRGDPGAARAVLTALNDEDWQVRDRAMDAAVNAYVPIPESALLEHAQSDPSPEVRFLALAGIAARIDPAIPDVGTVDPATARAAARLALSDASEPVRWQGQQILDTLDGAQSTTANDDQAQLQEAQVQ